MRKWFWGEPGSKVWDFVYKDNGQVDFYDHPNGLRTDYTYDANDILTKIAHKDGAAGSTLQSFTYAFDDVYNITKITHADGSYWDYEYDGRYRLTKAVRNNKPSPTISATWEYTYDDGDNLLTKVIPFEDDFGDGTVADDGWSVSSGTWSVVDGAATNTKTAGSSVIGLAQTDGTAELQFAVRVDSESDTGYLSRTAIRYQNGGEKIELRMSETGLNLYQLSNSTWTLLDSSTSGLSTDTWYEFRADMDGADIEVWMRERDGSGPFVKELDTSSATVLVSNNIYLDAQPGSVFGFDDIRVLSDSIDRTVTYFYNAANELTKITDYNGDTTFNYDAWGRTTKKTRGTDYVDYAYRYGGFLHEVDATNWLNGDKVNYDYGGNLKRRERTTDSGDYTWFNWAGFSVISEEDENATTRGDGDLAKSYFAGADVVGNDPSTAAYRYFTHDHLGSTRAVYDQNKNQDGDLEYTPYGDDFLIAGPTNATHRFTGHDWDTAADLYFAPFRYYSADAARWITRDPLGMVDGTNLYLYVSANPVRYVDPLGLCEFDPLALCGGNPWVLLMLIVLCAASDWNQPSAAGPSPGSRRFPYTQIPKDPHVPPWWVPPLIHGFAERFRAGAGGAMVIEAGVEFKGASIGTWNILQRNRLNEDVVDSYLDDQYGDSPLDDLMNPDD